MIKKVVKNSVFGLVLQIFVILLNIPIRYFFISRIGIEWLGINETMSSVIASFSLAELGLNSIIGYYLYEPIVKKDTKKVNEIVNLYKVIYRWIGCFVIIISIIMLPFLKYLLKGVEINALVYLAFVLLVINTVFSYFLSYRRVLLEADQKQYIQSRLELFFTLFFSVLQLLILIYTNDYFLFLSLQLVRTIISNVVLHIICGREYRYLKKCKVKWEAVKNVLSDLKKAAGIKIASYVYCNTDNIIISALVSTSTVGYLSNYFIISNNIKNLIRSILYPIYPTIGNIIAEKKHDQKTVFEIYYFVAFVILGIFIIPMTVLAAFFVTGFFGQQYTLHIAVIILLSLDCILDTLQIPIASFINGNGLFKIENKICIVGALVNLITSLLLLQKYSFYGVLLGTVISQFVFTNLRTYTLFKYCIGFERKKIIKHCYLTVKVFVTLISTMVIAQLCFKWIVDIPFVWCFIFRGITCEILFVLLVCILWGKDPIVKMVLAYFFKTRSRGEYVKKNKTN